MRRVIWGASLILAAAVLTGCAPEAAPTEAETEVDAPSTTPEVEPAESAEPVQTRWDDQLDKNLVYVAAGSDGYGVTLSFGDDDVVGAGVGYRPDRVPTDQASFDVLFEEERVAGEGLVGARGCPGVITDSGWVEVANIISGPFLMRHTVDSVSNNELLVTSTSDSTGTVRALHFIGYEVPDLAALEADRYNNCAVPIEEARSIAQSLLDQGE